MLIKYICLTFFLFFLPASLFSQARAKFDSLYKVVYSGNLPDDSVKVRIMYELAILTSKTGIQTHNSDLGFIREAEGIYFDALDLSRKINFDPGMSLFFQTVSIVTRLNDNLPLLGYPKYYDRISQVKIKPLYLDRHQVPNGSIEKYNNALIKFGKDSIADGAGTLTYWLGICYYHYSNYKKALLHFSEAELLVSRQNDPLLLSDILQFKGTAFYHRSLLDSAIIFYNMSLTILDSCGGLNRKLICLNNLGELYFIKKMYDAALNTWQQAGFLSDTSTTGVLRALNMLNTGKAETALGNYGKAETEIKHSIAVSEQSGNLRLATDGYYRLYENYIGKGDLKNALSYFEKFASLNDSLLTEEFDHFLKNQNITWQNTIGREITKKERETIQKELTNLQLNQSKVFLAITAVFSLFLVITAGLIYRSNRHRKRANEYLLELNRSREKLFSVISHDLRGPVIGFIGLLEPLSTRCHELPGDQVSQHLKNMLFLSQNIRLMLDNLLEWAKNEQGISACHPEIFHLKEAIVLYLDIYKPIAVHKGIHLEINIDGQILVEGDKNMVQLVIRNLLNNAVKYTPPGGTIQVGAKTSGDFTTVSVSDTGKGFSKGQIENLFGENPNTFNKGIGLNLCKENIEKCGGKIRAESQGENLGATFYFTLKIPG